ncbi:MAG: DUF3299 domain-containing protein [Pseudomonadota bacterium]|nr:DUF3299 domain-containing protein [Pseudomonadota bacterium]
MCVFFERSIRQLSRASLLLLTVVVASLAQAGDYRLVEFSELLPDEDYAALSNPPAALAQIEEGSLEDQVASAVGQAVELAGQYQAQEEWQKAEQSQAQKEWDRALKSTSVRAEFDGQKVRIPGFIVPLEFDDHQIVTEFFLVPYYGACIHLPPPPPNQIILVQSKGVEMETIYDPFWVEGTLHTDLSKNDVATSAYRLELENIEPYRGP